MRKLIVIGVAGLLLAAPAAATTKTAVAGKQLMVAMHDPGCHWFYKGGLARTRRRPFGPGR